MASKGSFQTIAATVLHELGHAYDYLFGRNGSKMVPDSDFSSQLANDSKIADACNLDITGDPQR